MKAECLLNERIALLEKMFVELVVWRVPRSLAGSDHRLKYRLALVDDGVCVLRYDNEAGKGDHKHLGFVEVNYPFVDLETLMRDFWADVEAWRAK